MNITILGGTGFVGLSIINRLAETDSNITVITRNREKNKKILVYPRVRLIEADVNKVEELIEHTKKTLYVKHKVARTPFPGPDRHQNQTSAMNRPETRFICPECE